MADFRCLIVIYLQLSGIIGDKQLTADSNLKNIFLSALAQGHLMQHKKYFRFYIVC